MSDVGFRSDDVLSGSQITLLVVFLLAIWLVSVWLKRHGAASNWLKRRSHTAIAHNISIQRLDSDTSLYRFNDQHNQYLVISSSSGVHLLDKKTEAEISDVR